MLSDDDLRTIEAFTAQASPEPWYFSLAESRTIEQHMAFVTDLLIKSTGQDLYLVTIPQADKAPEDSPNVVAVTGNGLTSRENAQFITMAREILPKLLAEIRSRRTWASYIITTLQLAYRKHVMEDESVAWHEVDDALESALAEAMGDEAFIAWLEGRKE